MDYSETNVSSFLKQYIMIVYGCATCEKCSVATYAINILLHSIVFLQSILETVISKIQYRTSKLNLRRQNMHMYPCESICRTCRNNDFAEVAHYVCLGLTCNHHQFPTFSEINVVCPPDNVIVL